MLTLLLVSSTALAAGTPPADLGHAPTIPRAAPWTAPAPSLTTTPSGLRVAVLPQRQLPIVHVTVMVQAGADQDPAAQPGVAAAVAQMLEEGGAGTRTAPQLAEAFADLGAELQVHTDRNGVRLGVEVLSRNLDRALALLSDLLVRPRFDAAEWTRARDKFVAQILTTRDEPRSIADVVFQKVTFGAHPYGHPVLGTPSSVAALKVEDLRAFYTRHYGPRTTSVLLIGDVAPAEAPAHVQKAFDGWPAIAMPPPPPPAPTRTPPRFVIVDRPGAPQSEVRVGHVGLARNTPDFAAAQLLETVLGGSFTSRLNQNLREKHGYTYGARARFTMLRAPGPFDATAAVRTDVTAESIKEIVSELTAIRSPMTTDEVQKGRSLVMSQVVESFGAAERASYLISDLMLNDLPVDSLARLPAALEKLDVAALTKAAARLFYPEALTVVVVGDRKVVEPALRALPVAKTIEYRDIDGNPVKK